MRPRNHENYICFNDQGAVALKLINLELKNELLNLSEMVPRILIFKLSVFLLDSSIACINIVSPN